jgi:hypothetical protein
VNENTDITREELIRLVSLVPDNDMHAAGMYLRYLVDTGKKSDTRQPDAVKLQERESEEKLELSPYGWKRCRHCSAEQMAPMILIQQGKRDFWGFHIEAAFCESCGAGQIEALERDTYDTTHPDLHYLWYLLGRDDTEHLNELVKKCPAPGSYKCTCDIHRALRSACENLGESTDENVKEQQHRITMMVKKDLPFFRIKR